jgi:hypothetical protein
VEVMRCNTGRDLQTLTLNIYKRLNINYKRTVNASPYEKVFKVNYFDLSNRAIEEAKAIKDMRI